MSNETSNNFGNDSKKIRNKPKTRKEHKIIITAFNKNHEKA